MAKTYQELYDFLSQFNGLPIMERDFIIETEDSCSGEIHVTELQSMKLARNENGETNILLEDYDF